MSQLKKSGQTSSRAVCILGMHRSGTSTMARAINLLGVYLGNEKNFRRPAPENPEGFWECGEIVAAHKKLLKTLDHPWKISFPLPDGWHKAQQVETHKRELQQAIRTSFAGHALWGWKDPRTCLLLDLWKDLLAVNGTELLALFGIRHPSDVVNSLVRRNDFSVERGYGVWFSHNLAALRSTRGVRTCFMSYDNLLESGERELKRCASELGIAWPEDDTALRNTLSTFLRKDLRHSKSGESELQNAPRLVVELYRLLQEAIETPPPLSNDFFERVDRLHDDFHESACMLKEDVFDLRTELNNIKSSWSWKMTAPFRATAKESGRFVKRVQRWAE